MGDRNGPESRVARNGSWRIRRDSTQRPPTKRMSCILTICEGQIYKEKTSVSRSMDTWKNNDERNTSIFEVLMRIPLFVLHPGEFGDLQDGHSSKKTLFG